MLKFSELVLLCLTWDLLTTADIHMNQVFHVPMVKKPGRRIRRRLDGSSDAHFWDVKDHPDHSAIEGADYFYAVIQIGSPPKEFDMILDTGSHLAYIPCRKTCTRCGKNHHHHPYNRDESSTYSKLECSDKLCGATKLSCKKNECSFSISYMEGSSVHGTYMKEVLTLGPESRKVEIPVAIGCIGSETKLIYSQDADGILGLGDSPVSILNQFHAHGLPLSFGICFGSDNEGVMTFGSYQPPNLKFTPMVQNGGRESYFKVQVAKILIAGKELSVSASAYGASTLLDTGSSDTLVPRKIFAAFRDVMSKTVKGALTKERDGNLCFRNQNTEEMYASIPEMEIILNGDVHIVAPFANLIYKKQKTYICTTVFEHYGQMIIGGNTMMDHFIFLDRENRRVGVSKSNCKDLKAQLYDGAGGSVPLPTIPAAPVEENPGSSNSPATDASQKQYGIPKVTPSSPALYPNISRLTLAPVYDSHRWDTAPSDTNTRNTVLLLFIFIVIACCAYALYNTPLRKKHSYMLVANEEGGDLDDLNELEEEDVFAFQDEDDSEEFV